MKKRAQGTSHKAQGKLFVISGPSGSGKTTLAEKILKRRSLKGRIEKSISLTTRPKRPIERNKKDYFFISGPEFQRLRKAKKVLEWTRYLGYYYGTPKEEIDRKLKQGKNVVFCVDLKGVRAFKRIYPRQAVAVFVLPPSLEELRRRIVSRHKGVDEAEAAKRLALAREELTAAKEFDYQLFNEHLEETAARLEEIILKEIKNR